jgi:hypothetical protein
MSKATKKEKTHSSLELDASELDQQETSSRRALIQKYGKYAVVGGPLLLFVSKAHAIHSRP